MMQNLARLRLRAACVALRFRHIKTTTIGQVPKGLREGSLLYLMLYLRRSFISFTKQNERIFPQVILHPPAKRTGKLLTHWGHRRASADIHQWKFLLFSLIQLVSRFCGFNLGCEEAWNAKDIKVRTNKLTARELDVEGNEHFQKRHHKSGWRPCWSNHRLSGGKILAAFAQGKAVSPLSIDGLTESRRRHQKALSLADVPMEMHPIENTLWQLRGETLSSPPCEPCECTQKYDTLSLSSLQGKHIFTFSATVDCMDSNIWYSLFHRCQEGFTHAACFCMLLLGTQFAFSSAFSHKFSYLLVLHYLHITVSSSFFILYSYILYS